MDRDTKIVVLGIVLTIIVFLAAVFLRLKS